MKPTSIFDASCSSGDFQVFQLTEHAGFAKLIYPDQPSFLADGRRLVVNTSTGPVVVDPDDDGPPRPLFDDNSRHELHLTFDGRYGYFKRRDKEKKDLTLARIDLETRHVEDVFHADELMPGAGIASKLFGLHTVSGDNRHIACRVFLGDGKTPNSPFGIGVLDLDSGEGNVVASHRDFHNLHLQYCRSPEADAGRDLLIQMNHGSQTDETGKVVRPLGPPDEGGVDVHVMRDDGTGWRDMPFGRDGKESCIGHQVWRGRTRGAATVTLQNLDTSYGWADGTAQGVVAGWAGDADFDSPHRGRLNPKTRRIVLSQGFENPRFCHLACDDTGLKFCLDTFPIFDGHYAGMHLFIAQARHENSPLAFRHILNTGITLNANDGYHAHPILSPDGSRMFFNSNRGGSQQVYMVTGLEYPTPT